MSDPFSRISAALADRYRLEDELGAGGMATVYRARDLRHERDVAVKILRAEYTTGVSAERFTREIEIAAGLQHPNILPLFDSGNADGCLFYVMPCVEGATLRDRLRRQGALPWIEALAIVSEIGDALHFAHGKNVVHRDIKPENILFQAGHAVIADFGIARAIETSNDLKVTLDGHGLGTAEYMSPEQAFGEEEIDGRSDVYSLACMLYEMLGGQPPFVGVAPFAVLIKKTQQPVPEIRPVHGDVPLHVGAVVQSALSVERGGRPATAAAFVGALTAHTATGPVGVMSVTAESALPSIAVLPFANHSGDDADEFLGDGLSEELIHALSGVKGLRVVGRTSSFSFKGRERNIETIAEKLRVRHILDGSVRRAGKRLRVTAQLVDAGTGFERWSERYERELTDVFAVQDDITRAIVEALSGELLPERPAHVLTTASAEAYERYLEGRFHWNRRTEAGLLRSVELFTRALALDPAFAAAHVALGEAYLTLAVYGAAAPADTMPRAREAAERALSGLGPDADALMTRACVHAVYDWDWAAADRDAAAALALPVTSATAHQWYATNLLLPRKRFAEAHDQLMLAESRDPLSLAIAVSLGLSHHLQRDHLAAVRAFRQLAVRDPQFGMAQFFLGRACSALGDHDGALAALDKAITLLGATHEVVAARGAAAARAGKATEARKALGELFSRSETKWAQESDSALV